MLTTLLTLPLAPVRGLTALAELLRAQAERELYDPVTLQRRLAELDEAFAAGEISAEEFTAEQQQILDRLLG